MTVVDCWTNFGLGGEFTADKIAAPAALFGTILVSFLTSIFLLN